jgi:hypothetical protein
VVCDASHRAEQRPGGTGLRSAVCGPPRPGRLKSNKMIDASAYFGYDDDNKPVWPTWAVGALFRGARRILVMAALYLVTVWGYMRLSCGRLQGYRNWNALD